MGQSEKSVVPALCDTPALRTRTSLSKLNAALLGLSPNGCSSMNPTPWYRPRYSDGSSPPTSLKKSGSSKRTVGVGHVRVRGNGTRNLNRRLRGTETETPAILTSDAAILSRTDPSECRSSAFRLHLRPWSKRTCGHVQIRLASPLLPFLC
ncbi:hypothetical protein BD310DRAFT_58477 [Dichomitus squalens]|uniref:Uncharacterized protein n=1 Tax=Dichomitus squalens TaxID=114155 RepID=A0A4Q9Q627_9APHY|nr:hypothetical protein BD310DRAFT_58477 [Dichomitus squalens]